MEFLIFLGIIYLTAGTIYAVYIAQNSEEPIIFLPLNILLGPVVGLYLFYKLIIKNEFIR